MAHLSRTEGVDSSLTIWFDPVCPFTWNTARWLQSVAVDGGLAIDWQLMSLAVLNEGQEQTPQQQDHMHDSRQIGRLLAAIDHQHGTEKMVAAYFAFGQRYFDGGQSIDDALIREVCAVAGSGDMADAVPSDQTYDDPYDDAVRRSHQAGQDTLGETGGSPIVRINDRTFFGPVLTDPPAPQVAQTLFDAVAVLAAVPQFSQLKRPQTAG